MAAPTPLALLPIPLSLLFVLKGEEKRREDSENKWET